MGAFEMENLEKMVKLQSNMKGGWRDVLTFDVADQEKTDDSMHHGACLFSEVENATLRIIVPGDTAPLMNWSYTDGWREWRTGVPL
jgi:hypothetical protein